MSHTVKLVAGEPIDMNEPIEIGYDGRAIVWRCINGLPSIGVSLERVNSGDMFKAYLKNPEDQHCGPREVTTFDHLNQLAIDRRCVEVLFGSWRRTPAGFAINWPGVRLYRLMMDGRIREYVNPKESKGGCCER